MIKIVFLDHLTFPPMIQRYITTNTKFIPELSKFYSAKRFGENVGDLIFGRTINWFQDIFGNERPDMMILGVHMLCLSMKNWVLGKFDG